MSELPLEVCTCADRLPVDPEYQDYLIHFKVDHRSDCGAYRCGGCIRCIIDQTVYYSSKEPKAE